LTGEWIIMSMSEGLPMATSAPVIVPLAEYLETVYRPDRDWIDGETKERNVGEQSHARLQAYFSYLFRLRASEWGLRVLPEQRVQVLPSRFRVPDVCLIPLAASLMEIISTPPLLCIEILARDDRMSEIQERVDDYLGMGVPAVWVVDPRRRRAYTAVSIGSLQLTPEELTLPGTAVRVPVADVFAELNEMEAQP
jgi:Uma2 family endonuclease